MYLTERRLFFSVNHVFSGLTGRRSEEDFNWFASYAPAFEIRNGQMCAEANRHAETLAKALGKVATGGSDSHTLSGVARTYTQVPGARTVEEYFQGLRAGRGVVHGEHGAYIKLTVDIFRFASGLLDEKPWTAALLPFTVFIPAITAAHWLNELRFCKKWGPQLNGQTRRPRMLWEVDSGFQANWAS